MQDAARVAMRCTHFAGRRSQGLVSKGSLRLALCPSVHSTCARATQACDGRRTRARRPPQPAAAGTPAPCAGQQGAQACLPLAQSSTASSPCSSSMAGSGRLASTGQQGRSPCCQGADLLLRRLRQVPPGCRLSRNSSSDSAGSSMLGRSPTPSKLAGVPRLCAVQRPDPPGPAPQPCAPAWQAGCSCVRILACLAWSGAECAPPAGSLRAVCSQGGWARSEVACACRAAERGEATLRGHAALRRGRQRRGTGPSSCLQDRLTWGSTWDGPSTSWRDSPGAHQHRRPARRWRQPASTRSCRTLRDEWQWLGHRAWSSAS